MAGEMQQLVKTKIGHAIQTGDFRLVKKLIEEGEDVHFTDRKNNTYLHYVCTMYRPIVFHILAAQGLDINAQNKFGYTPLHVTALQKDSLHVADVLACGADPFLTCYNGKTAAELDPSNQYWHLVYNKFKPGIFEAVRIHNIDKVKQLLQYWTKVDSKKNGQTLRQFAAAHRHHDIVWILDQHRATMNVIYGVLALDYEKVKTALKKSWCQINFLNEASRKRHILQYAIRMKDLKLVKMLCDAGADVNTPVMVYDYFLGPLYYEVINVNTPPEIMWTVLKSNVNFNLKDERGRNALTYALDKGNGIIPVKIFKFMLMNGAYLGDRDDTGVGVREVAKFARRMDVVTLIDKFYIQIMRTSDSNMLHRLAVDGYGGLLINFNHRDSFIYASGNETDDVVKFVEWLPTFQREVQNLFNAIRSETLSTVKSIVSQSSTPEMLLNAKDKGLRCPLILATLFARADIVRYILSHQSVYDIDINSQDCCKRTAYHYTFVLDVDGEPIRQDLMNAGINIQILDVKGRCGEEYSSFPRKEEWVDNEIIAKYGMELELECVEKYEELRKIIRAKRQGLKEFTESLKTLSVPVAAFPGVMQPLMPSYRDLIFLAVDYGKEDIAMRLANLGADLHRTESYTKKDHDGQEMQVMLTVSERALDLGFTALSSQLTRKQERQQQLQTPLIPHRAKGHFQRDLSMKSSHFESIFLSRFEPSRR